MLCEMPWHVHFRRLPRRSNEVARLHQQKLFLPAVYSLSELTWQKPRLFEYLQTVYNRKKGESHMDTLAVCSAWALSLCALGKHDDAATFQATKWQAKSPLLLFGSSAWTSTGFFCTRMKDSTLTKLRSKVGTMTELLV